MKDDGFEVDVFKDGVDEAEIESPESYDAMSVFVGPKIDKEVLDKFSNLKLITSRSTGFDHIDLEYAKSKNISLGYVPNYGENTVAEFAFGLMITLSRKLYWSIDRIKEDDKFDFKGLEGVDLKEKTVGIIGTGSIGKHMIKMCKGFNMKVIGYDAYPKEEFASELGFKYVELDELLSTSDFISLHVPYLPSTHHLINKENIEKIKKGAYIINTSRGPVIETEALVLALKKGILAGAGLDVLEEENVEKDEMGFWMRDADDDAEGINLRTVLDNNILADMPNVMITPHNAFNTKEAKTRILDTDFENIFKFFSGGEVEYKIPEKK